MTQCERIHQHLEQHGSITAAEAMQEYGCMRLAARIADLRSAGIAIERRTASGTNRYGEKVNFALYELVKMKEATT